MKKKLLTDPTATPKEHVLLDTYETEIEFTCPVRGLVKQKVKVKRYQATDHRPVVDMLPSSSLTDQLDQKFSGLLLGDDTVDDNEKDKSGGDQE